MTGHFSGRWRPQWRLRPLAASVFLSAALIGTWMIRGYFLSGFPLFPIGPSAAFMSIRASVKQCALKTISALERFNKTTYRNRSADVSGFHWVPVWFLDTFLVRSGAEGVLPASIAIGAIVVAFWSRRKRFHTPDAGSEVPRRAGSNVEESGSSGYLGTSVIDERSSYETDFKRKVRCAKRRLAFDGSCYRRAYCVVHQGADAANGSDAILDSCRDRGGHGLAATVNAMVEAGPKIHRLRMCGRDFVSAISRRGPDSIPLSPRSKHGLLQHAGMAHPSLLWSRTGPRLLSAARSRSDRKPRRFGFCVYIPRPPGQDLWYAPLPGTPDLDPKLHLRKPGSMSAGFTVQH